jgi:hypothetical protein
MTEAFASREGLVLAQQIWCNNFYGSNECIEVVETMIQGGISSTSAAAIYDN